MPKVDTRSQVIISSARLFAQRGIAGTSVRAIAEACGIQAASLYHHFESKDEIVVEIMERSSDHVVALYRDIEAANLAPVARFEALIRATLENFQQHPEAAQIFYENARYVASAAGLARVRAEARANDRLWVDTIEQLLAINRLRPHIDPSRVKLLLRNMIWSTTRGLSRNRTSNADLADEIVQILMHGYIVAVRPTPVPPTKERRTYA